MSEHSNPESCVTWYFRTASEEDECHCAEVLAEMGGKRMWWCLHDFAGMDDFVVCSPPEHGWKGEDNPAWAEVHRGCGWVWIVPEGGE
jgi:hypothetical protein